MGVLLSPFEGGRDILLTLARPVKKVDVKTRVRQRPVVQKENIPLVAVVVHLRVTDIGLHGSGRHSGCGGLLWVLWVCLKVCLVSEVGSEGERHFGLSFYT